MKSTKGKTKKQQNDFSKQKTKYFLVLVTDFKNYFPANGDAFKNTKRGYCQAREK